MIDISLSESEQTRLNNLLTTTDCAKTHRRVQAILWLDEGWQISEIALQLQVTRQTVSIWRTRFLDERTFPANQWLKDKPRLGRPRKAEGQLDAWINEVIDKDPRDFGYHCTTWTASLLVQYVNEFHQIVVGEETVRRALARLDIHWKRPRHDLAVKAHNWRQAKGGLNVA
jgi:transposase